MLTLSRFADLWVVSRAVIDIDQSAGPDRGVNLTEVANHPSAMWNRTVTISAKVAEVVDTRLILIGSDARFTGDHLLVATRPGATLPRDVMDLPRAVRVTGVVRRADDATWQELGIDAAGIPPDYESQAVLVAESVEPDPPAELGPGDKEFASATDGYDIGITAYDLTHDGDDYLGQRVVVSGEVEEHLLTPHLFLLGDEALLVVSGVPRPELFVEATAYVTGDVRRFRLEDLESELGIDLDDARVAPYEGRIFVLAQDVELVA